ncbi:isocitrate lyase/PEP mutase family protein [Tritonibacter mobilis]|uniref:isocitrate lyase/PEP mutase family protein n=1 Tax=Tritonibacter mobilis TaxID=379347 RepID=UPI003A5BF353
MSQIEKATRFAALHQKGDPVVLYNIWDAAGAKALAENGAPAVATGSLSMAAAHGYADGESMPLDFVLRIVARICETVSVPVTVDFEGGYATAPSEVGENVRKVLRAGAVGINFEDRVVGGSGLHPVSVQVNRIHAIKTVAAEEGVPLFINARTDLFLGRDPETHRDQLPEALERAAAYSEAGACGFFVPGLTELDLIAHCVEHTHLPVNVMMRGQSQSLKEIATLNVARISYGPGPFFKFLTDLKAAEAGLRA